MTKTERLYWIAKNKVGYSILNGDKESQKAAEEELKALELKLYKRKKVEI